MHRPQLLRLAAAVLGLLVLLPALAACGDDELAIGTVIQAREDSQFVTSGTASSIALPLGRLEISAEAPTKKIAANDTRQLEAVEAPAGSAFIPITWQYDAGTFGDYAEYLATDASPVVDLLAAGAKYRLAAPESTGEGAESFYVLVTGDGKDAQLAVDFDGVTQTVELATGKRDEGRAAPLYDLKPSKERTRSCSAGATFDVGRLTKVNGFACKVSRTAQLPYAGDAWAEEGSTFVVVSVTTTIVRYDEYAKDLKSGAVYVPTDVASTFATGKVKPTAVIEDRNLSVCPDASRGGCTKVYHLIFAADPDKMPKQMRIKQDYTMTLFSVWGNGESKDSVTVTGSARIPLR